jgi:hypothetical protein
MDEKTEGKNTKIGKIKYISKVKPLSDMQIINHPIGISQKYQK